jgi:hypothetical protein
MNAWAADETNRPIALSVDLREQLKAMSPAERDAKLKELREPHSRPRPEREQVEKQHEELKNLTPSERQTKLKEYRAASAGVTNKVVSVSPEERIAKRNELRSRLQERIDNIRTNTAVKLSDQERKRFLDRMQDGAKSFDRATSAQSGK